MILGNEIEEQIYETEHIQQVLDEIGRNFPDYFESFSQRDLEEIFSKYIESYESERRRYRAYLDLGTLEEFEFDAGAFKGHTRSRCPIIHSCLMAQADFMKDYKRAFNNVSGRELLDTVRKIADFGVSYSAAFDDHRHEEATLPEDLGLETLNDEDHSTLGVIGYGIQSALLYGLYSREFAHRSQSAVWALYFLSGREDFGLLDGSEFLMVQTREGTCEQNYFYPAQLFGFYSLQLYLMLNAACRERGVDLSFRYRYVYLSAFSDHIGHQHSEDISTFTRSSEYVETKPWFWINN